MGGGFLLLIGTLALFHVPAKLPPSRAADQKTATSAPTVEFKVGGEQAAAALFREDTTMRDPTPLFLPTSWNASENALSNDAQREPGSSFRIYPPRLTFPDSNLALDLPPPIAVPAQPSDAFASDKPDRPFIGFGQTDGAVLPLPNRAGYVRVVSAGDGRLMVSQPISDAKPPEVNWQPLEFVVAIDDSGMVRPPVLTDSSRVAAVDNYFRDYLLRTLHLGESLPPGFYRVYVGP